MRPLIAVTTTMGTGGRHDLPQVRLNVQYLAAVEGPGGTAVAVTPAHDAPSVERLVGLAHGLLLSGGEDVHPSRYGQEPHPALGYTSPARDEMECAALRAAMRRELPVLAICRGVQLLNVVLGGTLFQDLPSQRPGPIVHEQEAPVGRRWHEAAVEPSSGLHRVFGADGLFINSFHHQGIDRLAGGLEATVWAEDGLIEGVEARDYPWMYGVQWHPERHEAELVRDERDPDRRLLWAFVEASRRYMEEMEETGSVAEHRYASVR